MQPIKKAYIASPLGFSEVGREFYYGKLLPELKKLGLEIIDPWVLTSEDKIMPVVNMEFGQEKRDAWARLNLEIGKNNTDGINACDILISILDGTDVDSGTASEIGHAAALNKSIEGYRGDFRLSADNIGSIVNLQVEYFIRASGGTINETLNGLLKTIKENYIIL